MWAYIEVCPCYKILEYLLVYARVCVFMFESPMQNLSLSHFAHSLTMIRMRFFAYLMTKILVCPPKMSVRSSFCRSFLFGNVNSQIDYFFPMTVYFICFLCLLHLFRTLGSSYLVSSFCPGFGAKETWNWCVEGEAILK